jgi:hypothetical protein
MHNKSRNYNVLRESIIKMCIILDKTVKTFKKICAFLKYVCEVETQMWLIQTRDVNLYGFLLWHLC